MGSLDGGFLSIDPEGTAKPSQLRSHPESKEINGVDSPQITEIASLPLAG
jgi:hypothetical protein